ncbi:hypothetical protein KUTeg_018588 [Tegillarca granosa]|uniref:Uncharacterized protein n=1 Tax=Tegillarca granosa TaxID=220873 RepID=A0ABQ9EN82_TEGGR|nr:hypothetical protein KUTeg_018588 [Tegillarca granosa]
MYIITFQDSSSTWDVPDNAKFKDPMKVVHKEQDIITAFALNQANANCVALSTQKEIVELDVGALLHPPAWLEDENEMDIEFIRKFLCCTDTLDVQQQHTGSGSSLSSPQTSVSTPTLPQQNTPQTGRGTNVGIHIPGITNPQFSQYILDRSRRLLKLILRRPVAGIRRIGSHPALPHYLTGSADGSVRLYEWGHIQPLTMLRQPGAFPKVTKVLFNAQGNKCCVSDAEGDICLWQVGIGTSFNKPIMYTGIFDIRQRQIRHTFQAHDSSIRCLAIDPEEEYFVTGSAEGDIKVGCIFTQVKITQVNTRELILQVWGLDIHQLIVSFQGEHSKTTFFRNMGAASGVTQLAIGSGHNLFSCGVDGSMKFRALPERDSIVRYWSAS